MSKNKIVEGLEEAVRFSRGEDTGARVSTHPASGNGDVIERAKELIQRERQRQISEEGWTAKHDDQHADGELLRAAVFYLHEGDPNHEWSMISDGCPLGWPWHEKWWKPKGRKHNLIIAGALCLAEKDRLRRKTPNAHIEHVDQKLNLAVEKLAGLLKLSEGSCDGKMREALEAAEAADNFAANCEEHAPEMAPETCEHCFPLADRARVLRRTALGLDENETCTECEGTGVMGHPDSNAVCGKCRGLGGVSREALATPAPSPIDAEGMRERVNADHFAVILEEAGMPGDKIGFAAVQLCEYIEGKRSL